MRKRERCKHGKRPIYCKDCHGRAMCEHGRYRSACKECHGSQVCEHDKLRYRCVLCEGSSICKHKRLQCKCKECGGFPTLAKEMHQSAKRRAKVGRLSFTITIGDILKLIGNGVCPILGISYNLTLRRQADASASLDRFNPKLGYDKENCFVMSSLANRIKTSATTEQVCRVAVWMKKQQKKLK